MQANGHGGGNGHQVQNTERVFGPNEVNGLYNIEQFSHGAGVYNSNGHLHAVEENSEHMTDSYRPHTPHTRQYHLQHGQNFPSEYVVYNNPLFNQNPEPHFNPPPPLHPAPHSNGGSSFHPATSFNPVYHSYTTVPLSPGSQSSLTSPISPGPHSDQVSSLSSGSQSDSEYHRRTSVFGQPSYSNQTPQFHPEFHHNQEFNNGNGFPNGHESNSNFDPRNSNEHHYTHVPNTHIGADPHEHLYDDTYNNGHGHNNDYGHDNNNFNDDQRPQGFNRNLERVKKLARVANRIYKHAKPYFRPRPHQ